MRTNLMLKSAVVAVAVGLVALPAFAQPSRGEQRGDRERGGRQAAPAPRGEERRAEPRGGEVRRYDGGDRRTGDNRSYESRSNDNRSYDNRSYGNRSYGDRSYDSRRYDAAPRYNNDYRGNAGPRYAVPVRPAYRNDYYRPSYRYSTPYRPYYFSRPYYSFRRYLDLGFGLWLGYSVPYPHGYISGYSPRIYGDGSVAVAPGYGAYGGVSFDVSPSDAGIWVDGEYVGIAADFPPNAAPLTLVPGRHRIELQAEGLDPAVWDVNIISGQVLPYAGTLGRRW